MAGLARPAGAAVAGVAAEALAVRGEAAPVLAVRVASRAPAAVALAAPVTAAWCFLRASSTTHTSTNVCCSERCGRTVKMKIKMYVVDLEIPPRAKRWALRIGLPVAVIVGGLTIAYAAVPKTWG